MDSYPQNNIRQLLHSGKEKHFGFFRASEENGDLKSLQVDVLRDMDHLDGRKHKSTFLEQGQFNYESDHFRP